MSSIARKGIETFVMRSITQVISIAIGVMLARQLGASGKGVFAYAGTTLGLLLTVAAGQSAAVSWQYGRLKYRSGEVWDASRRFFVRIMLPAAIALGIIGFVFGKQHALLATAAAVPAAFFLQMSASFALAEGNVRVPNAQAFFVSGLFALTVAIELYIFHVRSVTPVLIAWVCCSGVVCLYASRRLAPYVREHLDGSHLVRQQLAFGAKVSANAIVSYLNFNIDVYIVLALLGTGALGVYTVAVGFGQLLWQLTQPLAFSAFGTVVSSEREQAAQLTAKCVRHALLWMLPFALVIVVAGPQIVRLLYGERFEYAGTVARYLLPGMLSYSAMPFFANYFSQQLGRPLLMVYTNGTSTIICALASLLLIPRLGIAGGAIATSVSYTAAALIALSCFVRESGMPLGDVFRFKSGDWRPYANLLKTSAVRVRL